MTNELKDTLELECTSCKTSTTLKHAQALNCKKCEKSLLGKKYRQVAFTGALYLFGAGGMVGAQAVNWFNDRYPMAVEYEIIQACANNSQRLTSIERLASKQKVCACALEHAQKDISYSDFKEQPTAIAVAIKSHAASCI